MKPGLGDLLLYTADRKCKVPHDKVYALYSAVPKAQETYPLDYTKPIQRVLTEATAFVIDEPGGGLLLNAFGLRHDRLSNVSYPSWVPDFRYSLAATEVTYDTSEHRSVIPHELTRAGLANQNRRNRGSQHSANSFPLPRVGKDLTTLELRARNLGPVHTFKFAEQRLLALTQLLSLFRGDISGWSHGSAAMTLRAPHDALALRIVRASLIDFKEFDGQSLQAFCQSYQPLAAFLQAGGDLKDFKPTEDQKLPGSFESLYLKSMDTLVGKTFVLTKGGMFGIGMSEIEDGDILVIPLDLNCPLVLRREANSRPESRSDDEDCYKIAGMATMDGLTRGLTDKMVEQKEKEGCLPMRLKELAEFDSKLVQKVKGKKVEKFLLH